MLYGTIPDTFASLTGTTTVDLSVNFLSGTLPRKVADALTALYLEVCVCVFLWSSVFGVMSVCV